MHGAFSGLGTLFAALTVFGCGNGCASAPDAGTDAGAVQQFVDANVKLIDAVCDCVRTSVSKASCVLVADLLFGTPPPGAGTTTPDLSDLPDFRQLSPDERACVQVLVEENAEELEPHFTCLAGVAVDGASCYAAVASVAFSGECDEGDFGDCSIALASDLEGYPALDESLAGELSNCMTNGTAADFIDGLIDTIDAQCECDDSPEMCRARTVNDLREARTCIIDELGDMDISADIFDCVVDWMNRGQTCIESAPECGPNRDFCDMIGFVQIQSCSEDFPSALDSAFTTCIMAPM